MNMSRTLRLPLTLILALAIVLVAVAPFVSQPTAQAQGGFNCPLSAEDCAIIEGAVNSSGSVASVNVDALSLVFNMEAGPEGTVSLSIDGSGPIVMTGTGIAPFNTDMTINGSMESSEESESIEGARIVILNDMAYAFDPSTGEWEVEEVTAEDMEGLDLSQFDLEAILAGLTMYDLGEGVVVWQRAEDMDMDGTNLAVFTVDVRLGELLVSPQFAQLASELATLAGDEEMDAESIGFIIGMLASSLKPQLDEAVFRLTFAISPEDSYVYGMSFDIDMDLDLAFLGALAGESESIPPISIFVDMDMVLSGYNQTYEIVAPVVE